MLAGHAEARHEDDKHDGPGTTALHVRLLGLLNSLFHSVSPLMKQTMEARQDARHPTLVMAPLRLSIAAILNLRTVVRNPASNLESAAQTQKTQRGGFMG